MDYLTTQSQNAQERIEELLFACPHESGLCLHGAICRRKELPCGVHWASPAPVSVFLYLSDSVLLSVFAEVSRQTVAAHQIWKCYLQHTDKINDRVMPTTHNICTQISWWIDTVLHNYSCCCFGDVLFVDLFFSALPCSLYPVLCHITPCAASTDSNDSSLSDELTYLFTQCLRHHL